MIASVVKKMVCYINLVDVCFYLYWGQYVPLYYLKLSLRISAFQKITTASVLNTKAITNTAK